MEGIIGVSRNIDRLLICFSSSSSLTVFVLKILVSFNVQIDGNNDADGFKRRLHSFVKELDPSKILNSVGLL